jgi:predicted TPR repeat methyltransferase
VHPAQAPLLQGLLERAGEERRWTLLDLGPALPGNLTFLGRFRCRLTVADALDELAALGRESDPDPEVLEAELGRLLPDPGARRWDLVLCWDLVNYLSRAVLSGLMSHLAPRLENGALIHAFVESSRPRMPPRPGRYELADGPGLRRFGPLEPSVPSPRYSHWELVRCWPACASQKSLLLKSGMQEYLFRYR